MGGSIRLSPLVYCNIYEHYLTLLNETVAVFGKLIIRSDTVVSMELVQATVNRVSECKQHIGI